MEGRPCVSRCRYFFLVLSLLSLCARFRCWSSQNEVYVDPVNGSDAECLSLQERLRLNISDNATVSEVPCRTLNRALGDVDCDRSRWCAANTTQQLEDVVIRLSDGVHQLRECLAIVRGANITIEAENTGQAVVTCSNDTNATRSIITCHTEGITFRGIRFENCGPLSPNIFVSRSSEVLVEDCSFAYNTGAVLQLQFVPSITIIQTNFSHNRNQVPAENDTNETTIDQLYNSITTAGAFTFFSRGLSEAQIIINDCYFVNNSANTNDAGNTRPTLFKANGHGGAVLIRLAQVEFADIDISDCYFVNNQAEVDGGAVYFSLSENFSSSSVRLSNNKFIGNKVESSGGAVSLNSFSFSFNNTFVVEDCQFERNSANAGGAFSIALYDTSIDSIQWPDTASFINCDFHDNLALNEGSAVGLFSLVHVDEVGFPVNFTNCTFDNNTSNEQTAEHGSALVTFRFPMNFNGYNFFRNNIGGGVTLLNTILRVRGTVLFHSNTAMFGGGIAMDDRCLMEITPGVNISFINNTAEESGGGIHVTFPAIRYTTTIFNRLCFLQYSDPSRGDVPPQNWTNVNISFINNTAGLSGAAIYASDMQLCLWLGNDIMTDNPIFKFPEKLASSSPFHYEGNKLQLSGQENIRLATDPYRIVATVNYTTVQPGETLSLELRSQDQVNNSREAVWSLQGPQGETTLDGLPANNETYNYRIPTVQTLFGVKDVPVSKCSVFVENNGIEGDFSLDFSLPGTLGFGYKLNLSVSGCHPGYILDMSTCVCECNTDDGDIVRCDENNRYIYLRTGVWGSMDNKTNKLVTTNVLPSYVECKRDGNLPGCLYNFDSPDDQCSKGRQGVLCGECEDDFGVTLDLQSCTPSSLCVAGLVLFIALCFLVVGVSLMILILNVELPNELKGFIFYAQVIGLVYRPFIVLQTESKAIDPLGIVLNLLGFSIPIPLCISSSLRAHHLAPLGYISPLLALFMVIIYVFLARKLRILSNRSALKGIIFLSLFIYKYIADTSFLLISCISTDFGFVFQFDGTVSCSSFREFGLAFVVGLLVVLLFVAPLPAAVGCICVKRPRQFHQYVDILTKEIKKEYAWFGGWDIGRRLPFVFFGYILILARPSLVLFLMALAATAVLLVHVIIKPYEKWYINIIETLILLNLVAVTVVYLDPSENPVPEWLSTTLVLLPYAYCIGYLLFRSGRSLWRRFLSKQIPLSLRSASFRSSVQMDDPPLHDGDGAGDQSSQRKNSNIKTDSSSRSEPVPSAGDNMSNTLEESYNTDLREPLLESGDL